MKKNKLSTKEIDKIAMDKVIEYEENNGRYPEIIKNMPYDIISGKRLIEVKGTSHNYGNVGLKRSQYIEMNNSNNWYMYLVTNIGSSEIQLFEISGQELNTFFNDWIKEYKLRIPKKYLNNKKIDNYLGHPF